MEALTGHFLLDMLAAAVVGVGGREVTVRIYRRANGGSNTDRIVEAVHECTVATQESTTAVTVLGQMMSAYNEQHKDAHTGILTELREAGRERAEALRSLAETNKGLAVLVALAKQEKS